MLEKGLILDASATLARLVARLDPAEVVLSEATLQALYEEDAVVPALWYSEITNGILVAERRGVSSPDKSALFLSMVREAPIVADTTPPSMVQTTILALARTYGLTAYDATYLELVLRTGKPLATFDRRLAEAVRKAGGRVFGDGA